MRQQHTLELATNSIAISLHPVEWGEENLGHYKAKEDDS
jgi:hypothetical protein